MVNRWVPLTAKEQAIGTANLEALIDVQLAQSGFAGNMIREMADYPAAKPWKGPTPKKGLRKGGRRTGGLGRGWKLSTHKRGRLIIVDNKVVYGIHVQGPRPGKRGKRQTKVMRDRNWPNITDTTKRVWRAPRRAIIRILQQRDSRIRRRRLA
ncbi:hypothetical protein LCGC14_1732910 [marine sediment metagenome]|uniref:Phage virion morphogenesis protein n=1 Tax=marine sediment metagenome TaxID=412755 RepID=A0A0F9JPE5_9ZZZZ